MILACERVLFAPIRRAHDSAQRVEKIAVGDFFQ